MLEDALTLVLHLQLSEVPINLELENQVTAVTFIDTIKALLYNCKR